MQTAPLSSKARVRRSSAARWRYVKRTRPSRSRSNSSGSGSFTLRTRSVADQTSSTDAIWTPTASYAASGRALPSPAPASMTTSCPRRRSSTAPAGVSATRCSSGLISLTTPIRMEGRQTYLHELCGETSGGEGGAEEPGIVVRPPPHVGERQTGTGLLPVRDVDLLGLRRALEWTALRPGDAVPAVTQR